MRCILALLLVAVLPLCGCAAVPRANASASPEPSSSVLPSAAPMPSGSPGEGLAMFYLLAASTWQDVYDETYILTFDALAGTMTEENTALNSKQVYRVVAEGEELYAWAEEDGVRREISFALEDGLLSVDYGEPLGVITYAAMEKTS